jgi:hypothetical protein
MTRILDDEEAALISDPNYWEYEHEQVSAYIENEIDPASDDQWGWITDQLADSDDPSSAWDELRTWRQNLILEFRTSLRRQYLQNLRETFTDDELPQRLLDARSNRLLRLFKAEQKKKLAERRRRRDAEEQVERLEWKNAGLEAICERQREFCPHCGDEKEMICPHCR